LKSSILLKAVNQVVGENIRLHRSRNRLSLAELAGVMAVDVQQIDQYERGIQSVPAHQLLNLAKIFAVHFSVFFNTPAVGDDFVRPSADQIIHN
jgi:transcriptional regulator with XRE-family HTH domain